MQTYEVVCELTAQHQVVSAEIQRVQQDIAYLREAAKRYPEDRESFSRPLRELTRLLKYKKECEKEARLHLQCYDLHRPQGEKILKKLRNDACLRRAISSPVGADGVDSPSLRFVPRCFSSHGI